MVTKRKSRVVFTAILAMILIGLFSCARNGKEVIPSIEYAPYVNAYTGGVISRSSPIRIELTQDQTMVDLNQELEDNPFSFSPSLKGKAHWSSNNTIEFVPEEGELQSGKLYRATFKLGDFVKVDSKLKDFDFSFRVQESTFMLHIDPLTVSANTPEQVTVKGEIRFSDKISPEKAKEIVSVDSDNKQPLHISVEATGNPSVYSFTIAGIARKSNDYDIEIKADGTKAGIDYHQNETITIPSRNSFRVLSTQRIEQPENGIQIVFSDPISDSQDLKGLIEIPEIPSYIFQVTDNKVEVYFETNQLSRLTLKINEGVKNFRDQVLGRNSRTVSFSELALKPQVELKTAAAILPDSKNLIIPFRAVSLHAVDLSVIRIFENNVLTFMQNNSLSSANELRRSGRLIYKKTLVLGKDPTKDLHKWEDYSIDLAGLIKQEPGAIYRIVLSFKQEYSAYPCGGNRQIQFTEDSETLTKVAAGALSETEKEVWDVPEAYYYYNGSEGMDWSQYEWKERDNPCHASYYMLSERTAACNVLASDLGMIVKGNSNHTLWIAVNNILDTKPVEKAQVTVYNFQLQPIGKAETNGEGWAVIEPEGAPFIVVAEAGKQKAYVKTMDGEAQPVSRFDVGGKEIVKGLKGFVYGERGVWRPGDTLHISFILQDREKRIPDRHPVALEIYNPRGQFYNKLISTNGINGFYTFSVPTKADDPTGLWNAYVKVGGTAFHKALRIETIKPNRLKIDLTLPGNIIQASEKEIPATLSSAWLTGATASGLKAKVEMTLTKVNTQFKDYKQYIFNNPATEFSSGKTEVFDGKLDNEGKSRFTIKLPQSGTAPGMLQANITSRVFEPGGDASINTLAVPFSPFNTYVGINLNQPEGKYIETDRDHKFDVVTVDAEGNPVSRNNLEYKIYRVDWSWWWEDNNDSFGTYVNSNSVTPAATGSLNTVNGKGQFTFRVNYPDWGRYLVYVKDKESGHATGGTIFVDWPDWRGRSNKTEPGSTKMLAFTLDKDLYEPGETVTAILPASAGGRALVTLENGSTVIQREWIEVPPKGDTKYRFKVTPEMAPNVYLHISLLQPHAQTVNDLPIRMYGVMPIFVTDKQTVLEPQIKMPDVLRPEQEFTVTVSEKHGKPMTYTLAIVDDGLLDLTNFKTPDPWQEFYSREALGIYTWDMYDDVLGARAGSYGTLFSTGGDEAMKPSQQKANRFKPVVKYIGPFAIGKGKTHTHKITLPMYVGSVRAMVVAGQDGAYGHAEKTAQVRTPLMILSSLPRVLSTQEEILVPVNVFAMEDNIKNVTVSLTASGAGVQVTGGNRQSVAFSRTGDKLVYFKLKTGINTGKAVIRLDAQGNGQRTKETIEIEVRNPNPVVTLSESRWIESGKSGELNYRLSSDAPGNSIRLEVSRIPPVDITRRFDFLYNYQHHCTEQLTSKALPLLFIGQFKATDAKETDQIKTNVQEAIKLLYARQLSNGGFVYWPGDASADEWVTSYAGMFLTLAQEKGYAVNKNVINRWKRFQRTAAQNWKATGKTSGWVYRQADSQQAFRLYTLALAGALELGAMNRMKEMQELSQQAKWRLAAAYALNGKMKAANELVYQANTTVAPYPSDNCVYGSSDRDEAMILETLVLMKKEREALAQAKIVSRNLQQENWFSTQSTAFSLLAMARLAGQLSGTMDFSWTLHGKQQPVVKSAKPVYEIAISHSPATGTVVVHNNGTGAINADLITRTQLINDTLPALSNNLRIDVRYLSMNGMPADVRNVKQGTDFTAVVTVANISGTSDYTNLALTHIIPSGWEIYNERMVAPNPPGTAAAYTYQDIRDDRVLTYFDLRQGQSKTFKVRLQATYAGNFILPAIQCEAMYDPGVQARTKATRTTTSLQ